MSIVTNAIKYKNHAKSFHELTQSHSNTTVDSFHTKLTQALSGSQHSRRDGLTEMKSEVTAA